MIQEADYSYVSLPLDLPYDPGIYGPVFMSKDVYLITHFNSTRSLVVDVAEDAKSIFKEDIWTLFSIFCFSFTTSFILIHKMMGDECYILDSIWHMICIMLRNFDFNSRRHSKPLFFLFIAFMFFIISIFLSMFAASLIVKPDPDYVETFDEIPKRNLTPIFFRGMPYWKRFQDAKSGPYKEVWDVYRKIGTENCLLYFDGDVVDKFTTFARREDTASFCSSIWTPAVYPAVKSLFKMHLHVSKERTPPTLFGYLYSKNVSDEKRMMLDEK